MPGWGGGGGQTKWRDWIEKLRHSIHDNLKHPGGLWQAPRPLGEHGVPGATTGAHRGVRRSEGTDNTQYQDLPSKKAKKQLAAELAGQEVEAAAEDGWRLVYVDGWSKPPWKGSKHRVGGIGIYSQEDTQSGVVSISKPLPPELRQTNNAAELGGGGGGGGCKY